MGWAKRHIEKLQDGKTVWFRPKGNSMEPIIKSGDMCTVKPVNPAEVIVGDIVLCRVKNNEYLHIVKAIRGDKFQIGNNQGWINGWIEATEIFGLLKKVKGNDISS